MRRVTRSTEYQTHAWVYLIGTAVVVEKVAFSSFLDQLPPRLPPRPSTNPTFTFFLTQTPIMLTKELLQLPDAPSLLAQRRKLCRELPEHYHLRSAEDVLGLVQLTSGRRTVLPSMHGRSFTAPLTREVLRAERRAAQKEPPKAF